MNAESGGDKKVGSVLVVGGGIGGMQASLDLANAGFKVYLVERGPAIGGVMAQLDKTFPTNDCAMCTLAPRMVDCGRNTDVEKLTYSEVLGIQGGPGRFRVRLRKKARSVDPDKCTGCGECAANCLVRNDIFLETPEEEVLTLVPDELREVDTILAAHDKRREMILPILQDINARYNWLSPSVLKHVGNSLGMPLSDVLRIATFYNAFSLEPRGKHVVRVCLGTACHVKGGSRILESLERKLEISAGETTPDGLFTLEAVRCLGCCGLAPVITVDEDVHGKMTAAGMLKILTEYS